VGDRSPLPAAATVELWQGQLASAHLWVLWCTASPNAAYLDQHSDKSTVQRLAAAVVTVLEGARAFARQVAPPLGGGHSALPVHAAGEPVLAELVEMCGFTALPPSPEAPAKAPKPPPAPEGPWAGRWRSKAVAEGGRALAARLPKLVMWDAGRSQFGFPVAGGGPAGRSPSSAARPPTASLMTAMAQLRLASEVEQLQLSVGPGRSSRGPEDASALAGGSPFVVPDTACFAHNLQLLREVVALGNYVVVVSQAVLMGLDLLKSGKERLNKGAREATRYLEEAARAGQAHLHFQQPMEAMDMDPSHGPASREGMTQEMLGLMGCARYFAHVFSGHRELVSLLTGDPLLQKVAEAEGLKALPLMEFHRQAKHAHQAGGPNAAQGSGDDVRGPVRNRHPHGVAGHWGGKEDAHNAGARPGPGRGQGRGRRAGTASATATATAVRGRRGDGGQGPGRGRRARASPPEAGGGASATGRPSSSPGDSRASLSPPAPAARGRANGQGRSLFVP
jgi:hypothetical protein